MENKYLTLFDSHEDYEDADLIQPNVSYCKQEDEVHYDTYAYVTIKTGRRSTSFSYDKPLDFTNSILTAEKVTAFDTSTATTSRIYKVPANTGIVVSLNSATESEQIIKVPVFNGNVTDNVQDNLLIPIVSSRFLPQVENNSENYIFGKSGGSEKFIRVPTSGINVPDNNAYISVPLS